MTFSSQIPVGYEGFSGLGTQFPKQGLSLVAQVGAVPWTPASALIHGSWGTLSSPHYT